MTENPLLVSSPGEISPEELVSRLLTEFQDHYQLDLAQDPAAVQRIREAVGLALKKLQHQSEVEIFLPYISANQAGPIHLQRIIRKTGLDSGAEDSQVEKIPEPEVPQQVQVPLPDNKPVVTIVLLVSMGLIYLLQLLTSTLFFRDLPAEYGMKINQAILEGEYWRLLTPMFLHGSILHLGFNLYALYILGRRIERFFGSFRFLLLFLIAGITGNLFSFFFTPEWSLGSSTAIFGLLAAEGVFLYQHRELFGNRSRIALRQIIQVAVINFLIGLSPGIDNWGHLGGLVGGALFSWFAGPMLELAGTPPLVRFADRRSERPSILMFFIQLLLIIGLTAFVILSRS
jgi:rhomboid protease GluP